MFGELPAPLMRSGEVRLARAWERGLALFLFLLTGELYVHTVLQMPNSWLTRYMKGPTLAGIPDHDSRWSLHRLCRWLLACPYSICLRQARQIHFRGGERDRKED